MEEKHRLSTARLWSTESDSSPLEFRDSNCDEPFVCGAISDDEQWIAVGSQDRQARLWKIDPAVASTTVPLVVMQGHADVIEDIGFLGDRSSQRVMTASRDKSARIWDPKLLSAVTEAEDAGNSREPIQGREILALRKHSLGLTAIDATRSGNLLLTAGRDGQLILWPAVMPSNP